MVNKRTDDRIGGKVLRDELRAVFNAHGIDTLAELEDFLLADLALDAINSYVDITNRVNMLRLTDTPATRDASECLSVLHSPRLEDAPAPVPVDEFGFSQIGDAPAESSDVFAGANEGDLVKGADEVLRKIKPEVSRLANYLKIYQMLLRDFRPAMLKDARSNAQMFIENAIGWNFPLDGELDICLRGIINYLFVDRTMVNTYYRSALGRLEVLIRESGEYYDLDAKETAPESAVDPSLLISKGF